MPALVAGIHVFLVELAETWMAGIALRRTALFRSPMPGHDAAFSINKIHALCEIWTHSERWIDSTR
jgi:hypothetical protein